MRSELADCRTDRDRVYLRPAGGESGRAGGDGQSILKVTSLMRGRAWPGRYTLLEVEVPAGARAGFGEAMRSSTGAPLRLPLPAEPTDLRVSTSAVGRVTLVDDRQVIWTKGWRLAREADELRITFAGGGVLVLPWPGEGGVTEVGVVRARVGDGEGGGEMVYATGMRTGRGVAGAVPAPPVRVEISEDMGRVDRGSPGDAEGDGFDERRGAFMLRVPEGARRAVFDVVPSRECAVAVEIGGLSAGKATVLCDGRPVAAVQPTGDAKSPGLVVQLPTLRRATRVEVTVEPRAEVLGEVPSGGPRGGREGEGGGGRGM